MNNGKGKGRASGVGDEDSSLPKVDGRAVQSSKSTISRVLDSAKGLASSALAAPASNELNDRSSAALANAGKGQQSGSHGTSAWAESSKATDVNNNGAPRSTSTAPFRSHAEHHAASAEAEFSTFLDSIPPFRASEDLSPYNHLADAAPYAQTNSSLIGSEYHQAPASYTVQEQEARDGQEVLDLLSDPSTNLIEQGEIYSGQQEEEPVLWKLTDLQRLEWHARLKADFPSDGLHEKIDWEYPLNLIPSEEALGEPGRSQWLDRWENVLAKYTDEVWGDLLPIVREAREEVEKIREEPEPAVKEHPKALRRLGLILGHLRQ